MRRRVCCSQLPTFNKEKGQPSWGDFLGTRKGTGKSWSPCFFPSNLGINALLLLGTISFILFQTQEPGPQFGSPIRTQGSRPGLLPQTWGSRPPLLDLGIQSCLPHPIQALQPSSVRIRNPALSCAWGLDPVTHHLPRPVSGEGNDHQGRVHQEAVLIEGVVPVIPGDVHEVPVWETGRACEETPFHCPVPAVGWNLCSLTPQISETHPSWAAPHPQGTVLAWCCGPTAPACSGSTCLWSPISDCFLPKNFLFIYFISRYNLIKSLSCPGCAQTL